MAKRILVVDDDPGALKLNHYALQRQGYEVATVSNGPDALTLAQQERFDLAILDIMMPGMDGYEVCRRLRRNPTTANLPILMLTARALVRDKVSGFRSGTDEYITKPLLPSELVARVKALLLRSSLNQDGGARLRGHLLGFAGVKGDVGTSTLASNVAHVLAHSGHSVLLADLSPSSKTMQALEVAPSRALGDLLGASPPDISARRLEPCLVELAGGLKVLPTPSEGSLLMLPTDPPHLQALCEELAALAEAVILDLGCALYLPTRALVPTVDSLAVVSDSTPLGLRVLAEGWQVLATLMVNLDRAEITVIDRANLGGRMPREALKKVLKKEVRVIAWIPEGARKTEGTLARLAVLEPGCRYAAQVRKLARSLTQMAQPTQGPGKATAV